MEKRTSLIKLFTYQIWVLLCIIFISFISCNGGAGKKTESIVPPTAGLILIPDEPEKVGIDSDGNLISYNKVIIDFVDATQIDEINSIISSINGEITGYLPQIGVYEIRVQTTSATEIEALINSLSANPKVEFVEKNYTGKIIATDVETNPDGLLQTWGYESIKLPEAYRYLRSIGKYDDSTPDIVIAVIDNAIETEHPELKPNLLPNYYFYDVGDMDRDVRYTDIFRENFQAGVNGDKEFLNAKKHGTWVAGIAAGVNNGRLLNGVAYRAKIMPIKIFSSDPRFSEQVFFYFKLAGAILYATDLGADVINMSLGGSVLPGVLGIWQLNKAIDYAHSKGVVLIAGAGNDARDASFYYPATNSKVISVGGTDFFNERWVDSNYSSSNLQSVLSLAAPAKDIVGPDAENYYGAVIDSGTSASAPFVSGLAALLKALDPTLNSPQNPTQIEQIMRDTANNVPVDYNGDTISDGTWKKINVYNAVLATCPDIDLDGFSSSCGAIVDCNDTKNTVYPNAPELCDGIDNQCPGNVGYGGIDEGCGFPQCSDGLDNDSDGFIDFPSDTDCVNGADTNEWNGIVGTYQTLSYARRVFVNGNYAYVSEYYGEFEIIDISNPTYPNLIGFLDGYYYNGLFVSGNYAYVAGGSTGLHIINISNPSSPTLVSSYSASAPSTVYAYDVFVKGNYAYIAYQNVGLQIINVSNPSSPIFVGSYDTPGQATSVFISGSYAYVADYDFGLQIINISNPSSPTFVGSYNTPGYAYSIKVSGSYAYIADGDFGLQIINISNPSSPTFVGSYDTPDFAYDVSIQGNYAYVADDSSGLLVIDVSNPSSPTLFNSYNTPGGASGVVVSGPYAYVADCGAGLHIIQLAGIVLIPPLLKFRRRWKRYSKL